MKASDTDQLIKVEVSEERHVESWLSRNSRGVVESEESWKWKRHKIGKVEEPKNGEPEESTNGRIGRDVLSENRMWTLIFYYYSDSVKYRNSLFMKNRHSFTTIIPMNYFIRLATNQLYRPL